VPSVVLGGAGGIGVIDLDIDELGDLRDVRPVRQNAGSGGHDLVGGDVVADLEQDLQIDVIGQRFEVRQGRDVRSFDELDRPGFLWIQRWDEHLAVRGVLLGQPHLGIVNVEIARIGDLPGQCGSGRGLRRAQPHGVLVGAGPAGEVPRHGAQTVAPDRRSLTHADAAHTSGLVDPGPGSHQRGQPPAGDEVGKDLP